MLPIFLGLLAKSMGLSALTAAGIGAGIGALSNKKDPLGGALQGGLGGYSGANLGGAFAKMGAAGAGATAGANAATSAANIGAGAGAAIPETLQLSQGVASPALFSNSADAASRLALQSGNQAGLIGSTGQMGANMGQVNLPTPAQFITPNSAVGNGLSARTMGTEVLGAPTGAQNLPFSENMNNMGQGVKGLFKEGGWDAFKGALGDPGKPATETTPAVLPTPATNMQAGMAIGMPLLSISGIMNPQDDDGMPDEDDEDKYTRDGGLFLYGDKSSSALNLGSYATGGTIQQGGLSDLHGANDTQYGPQLSSQGYGLGRLNNLASQEAQARAEMGMYAKGGQLEHGGFVVPADVVSHLGNGSTDAGLALLAKKYSAVPIKGNGDGMSDSIATTIEGKEEARVADGEAYIPKDVVKKLGGPEKLYAMMDKVRHARTGTKKQGKEINPHRLT